MSVGVRQAIHQVLRDKGVDPLPLDPWYFPTAAQYSSLLTARGLVPKDVALFPRPTPLPGDLVGWLKTFVRNTFFASYDEQEQNRLMDQVQELCRVDNFWTNATPGMGTVSEGKQGEEGWEIMYVRIGGLALKSE